MISTKPSGLFLHVKSKHDKEVATPEKCFPALKGFDPANPDVARRRPALLPRTARARVRPAAAGLGAPRARDERARELASSRRAPRPSRLETGHVFVRRAKPPPRPAPRP